MRVVVQRVSRAAVRVDGHVVGRIDLGLMILAGFTHGDGEAELVWMARKLSGLRIFEDDEDKMNLSLEDVHGSVLIVPQFTLYADINKGRRPAFVNAAEPKRAETLYNRFCELLAVEGIHVERGVFGARMDVELVNDGPVTIIAEK